MRSRRDFIKSSVGALAAGAGFLTGRRPAYGQFEQLFPPSPNLTPFADPLPVPPVISPVGVSVPRRLRFDTQVVPHFQVRMLEFTQALHRDLPPTRLWGYEGMYPGPTIEVVRGQPVSVSWMNQLPSHHLLVNSIDTTLHGAGPGEPAVRTVVHLHGAKVLPGDDGHPEAWFTRNFGQSGSHFRSQVAQYPNDQAGAMLWYHDHTIGITRLNVVAGLAGVYLIREPDEDQLMLPRGDFEVPLVIQDKRFNADGSIWYPSFGIVPDVHPQWFPDYFGDTALVNGKISPFLEVEPKKYRFRVLNAANSRTFNLHLTYDEFKELEFVQIGADLGFMAKPVRTNNLLLTSAERADVIVDFAGLEGKNVVMTNDAFFPFGGNFTFPPEAPFGPGMIMQFRVRRKNNIPDASRIPETLPAEAPLRASDATVTRRIEMTEQVQFVNDFPLPTVLLMEGRTYGDPVGFSPKAGSTEIWEFVNGVIAAHPMHVHLGRMQVLSRQKIDPQAFMTTGALLPLGDEIPPDPTEIDAPKDTVRVEHEGITKVAIKFDLPSGTDVRSGQRFPYVYHCHILEHEDNEMMRPFEIVG